MKINFIKSLTAGILGLTLLSGCAEMGKKEAHKCSTKECKKENNSCKGQKKDCDNAATAKKEKHKCKSKSHKHKAKAKEAAETTPASTDNSSKK